MEVLREKNAVQLLRFKNPLTGYHYAVMCTKTSKMKDALTLKDSVDIFEMLTQ